jgi:broad specificity phosphatase PhoE
MARRGTNAAAWNARTRERVNASTTIWLARHGEAYNPRAVLYGRLPGVRLSAEGRRQAQALADVLAPRPLVAIYSSPMLRARRTAEVVLASHPTLEKIRIDSDLQEVGTSWQGEPLKSLESINWDFYGHPRALTDESLQTIHTRMHRWLTHVLRRHRGAEVLGVSHGDPILILTGMLRGVPLDRERIFPRPYIPTGSLYRMRFDKQGVCNDVELVVPHEEAAA